MEEEVIEQFSEPVLLVKIGNNYISQDNIDSFEFVSNEDEILPRCVIRFSDYNGSLLDKLDGLSVGSQITFSICDGDEENTKEKKVDLTPLAISTLGVMTESLEHGYNNLEIICEHPWGIFKDFSSHAYLGKSNSDIIKSLIKTNKERPFNFKEFDDKLFLNSDEDGSIPRYKCAESDLDFIQNKILPTTTINNSPVKFWIDDRNRAHLASIKDLFEEKEKVLIYGGNVEEINDNVYKTAENLKAIVISDSTTLEIGNKKNQKLSDKLKTKIFYDDPTILKSISGKLLPKVSLGDHSNGLRTSSIIPVSMDGLVRSSATESKYYRNFLIKDSIARSLYEQSDFNNMFQITIHTSFCGEFLSSGDNVLLYISPKENKESWLNGKWHVKEMRYDWDVVEKKIMCNLDLIRPSFKVNIDNTSLADVSQFYSVGLQMI